MMQLGRLTVVLLAVSAVALIVIIVIGATQARTPPPPTATPSPTFTPVPPTPTVDPTIVAATAAAQATASQLQAAATATVLACCELALRLVDEDGNPITDLIGYYYLQTVRPERRQERHYFKPGNTGGYVHTVEYGTQVVFELYPSGYKRVDSPGISISDPARVYEVEVQLVEDPIEDRILATETPTPDE